MMIDEVIRKADLPRYCGLKRSQIELYISLGKFPRPIKVGDRAVAWLASEIRQWQLERIAERDREAGK
jgi:prophage regulatory protein